MSDRLWFFIKGWRRKSLLLLDAAGCPRWLAHWRCRMSSEEREAWSRITVLARRVSPFEAAEDVRAGRFVVLDEAGKVREP